MKKKLSMGICIIFFISILSLFSGCSQKTFNANNDNNLRLVVDSKNENILPKHFRKSNDKIELKDNKALNLNGLSDLNISGSAEFSENGFKLIKEAIGNNFSITVVDLRQESHGFVNGMAVNWTDFHNKANKGLTKEQVLVDEKNKLNDIPLGQPITFDKHDKPMVTPIKVESEEELVKRQGASYVRIPVTDKEIPADEMVDYFIKFVKSMPTNTWLHFHCRAGVGRTTTFMVMYDAMKNCKKVSLEDIMNRQVLIGGKNLIVGEKSSDGNVDKRAEFVKKFYEYCSQNTDNFDTSWSEWLKNSHSSKAKSTNY